MKQVSKNVYVETSPYSCNSGFVVTREGVVQIDTLLLPADAVRWRDEIARHGPVRYVINTEPHSDHFTGNCFAGGTLVAHEGTRQAILSASFEKLKDVVSQSSPDSVPLLKDFRFRPPDITLSTKMTIYLGDHTFHLINMPGHTLYEVAVYIPEERVLFTSDNVFCRVQTWMQEALPWDWLASLQHIAEMDVDVLVPGHGDACDRSYIPEMKAFIEEWINAVAAAIRQGMSVEEAQEKISFRDRYPMTSGREAMLDTVQRWNVARLYKVLKP